MPVNLQEEASENEECFDVVNVKYPTPFIPETEKIAEKESLEESNSISPDSIDELFGSRIAVLDDDWMAYSKGGVPEVDEDPYTQAPMEDVVEYLRDLGVGL